MILNTLLEIIDGSNRELCPDVDMNTSMLPGGENSNFPKLINVCGIFGLSQLITEPTRVTAHSQAVSTLRGEI